MNPNTPTVNLPQAVAPTVSAPSINNGTYASSMPQVPQAPTVTSPPVKSPNLLERLLPTAGGIIGGLIGLPLNALDAVSGIGGTALDAGLAGGGSALGKVIENKLTGQGAGQGVLGAAAGGVIGQAGGEALGAVGSGISNVVGGKATDVAADMLQSQFADGTLTKDAAQQLVALGLNTPQDASAAADIITGSNGALSNGVKTALKGADQGIDITGLDTTAANTLRDTGALPTTVDTVGKNLSAQLNTMVSPEDQIAIPVKGAAPPVSAYNPGALTNALPEDVFGASQKFDQLASQAYKSAYDKMGNVVDSQALSQAKTYSALADELESRAFGTNAGAATLTLNDAAKQSIIDDLAPLKEISPQAYDNYVQQVTNANTVQELRPMQSLMVNASQAANGTTAIANRAAGTSAMDLAKSIGAPTALSLAHPVAALGSLALSSNTADRVGTNLLSKLGPALGSNVMNSVIAPGAGGIVGNLVGNAGNDIAPANANALQVPASLSNNTNMNPATVPNIFTALANPQAAGNQNLAPIGLQALLGMYDPALLSSTVENNANTAEQNLQKGQVAAAQLPNLATEFSQSGGGQGAIGGLISRLTGTIPGNAAANYSSQVNSIAQALSQATGTSISPNELPQLTQSPQVAQDTLNRLTSLLQALGVSPQTGTAVAQ